VLVIVSKVAFIMDQMFEDSEFKVPFERIKEAGHEPIVVGLEAGKKLEGKKGKETTTTDVAVDDVTSKEFDALVIPGGYSPDLIRTNEGMVDFTRSSYEAGKPVAAICHAGWMLAEAGIVRGKTVTSWPSIKTDLVNAGAEWVDQEVVEDGNLITSRKPDDLEAFSKALLAQIEQRS
jgi:deglycase